MIDGVYSMYGDLAPIYDILEILSSYDKLHIYADDAHGMSWYGENGKGYILSHSGIHPKIVVATSFAKAFGVGGGGFIFPDEETFNKVKNCGGPFIFSGPHQIPVLGAAIASAKIHLSEEIYVRQDALKQRIAYCHHLLKEYNLPFVSSPETPIFFVGLGILRMGHNMVKRLMNDGFYVNIAMFPAVSETCTGIRFTITLHQTLEDIENLVKALASHLPKALAEEERTIQDICRAFKKVPSFSYNLARQNMEIIKKQRNRRIFKLQHEKTIKNIPQELWDEILGNKSTFNWEGLDLLEESFKNNKEISNNWQFHYFIIRDGNGQPVLATYFTLSLLKDDMLAAKAVSQKIESERKKNPYFLTSMAMMMGCPLSVGEHIYLDKNNPDWRKALMILLDAIWKEQEIQEINFLYLRDFSLDDNEIFEFLTDQGFLQISLPDSYVIDDLSWENSEKYLQRFSRKHRYNLKQEVIKFESQYDIKILSNDPEIDVNQHYSLYKNVADKSFEISSFNLPFKFFENIRKSKHWEIIELRLKPQIGQNEGDLVGVNLCFKFGYTYNFLIVGIDYNYLETHNVYKQALWQAICRANKQKYKAIQLGLTAGASKRKLGAKPIKKFAYVQMNDNFNMALIEIMSKSTA